MTLRRMIRKLSLKPGDTILVRRDYHSYSLIQRIAEIGRHSGIKFPVGILEIPPEKHAVETLPFEQLEKAYLIAKEAHERRETEKEIIAGKNQQGTQGETIRPFAGSGTPTDSLSA